MFAPDSLYCRHLLANFNFEIMKSLHNAQTRVRAGNADAAIIRWFGAPQDKNSRSEISEIIGKLRSHFNIRSITLGFTRLTDLNNNVCATAWSNGNMQVDFKKALLLPSTETNLIKLNLGWNSIPNYLPTINGLIDITNDHASKFQTLIHELTHIFFGTDDIKINDQFVYGTRSAAFLARSKNSNLAIYNADNWGIFIEACGRNNSI